MLVQPAHGWLNSASCHSLLGVLNAFLSTNYLLASYVYIRRCRMFRNPKAMLLAFALVLLSLVPALHAQYSGPADPEGQTGQYPVPSQDAQLPPPQADSGVPGTDSGNPEEDIAADRKHGVARLSIIQGDVNIKRGDTGNLAAAVINAPLLTQDRLQSSDGSRAEVQLDSANLIRLAPDTDLGFASLEYRRYTLQLGAGTIIYRVLRNSDAQVEVDTPSVGFRPRGQGEFRLSVLEDGTTQITARSGQGEIFGPRGSQLVSPGQTVLVRGNAGDPEFQNTYEVARDQFDDWSARRDSELLGSQSYRYVSQDISGAEDLDRYGNWVPSQYGQVWAPQSEPSGWSPYSSGEWAWQDYYGWSWVDSSPWGWAPYHYGRWFRNGGYGWCWWPGAIGGSYFWNPALVGFFGWGGLGFGGGLGWVALAPFESFHRWWGPGWYGHGWYGRGYGGQGGFRPYSSYTRNVDIARAYRNARYTGAVRTASYNSFSGRQQRFSTATRAQMTNVNAFRGALPVTPTRASYQFTNRAAISNPRLAAASSRQFFQSSQIRSNVQTRANVAPHVGVSGAVPNSGFSSPRASHGVPPNLQNGSANGRASFSNGARSSGSGWQRFGDPGTGAAAARQGFSNSQEGSGWHRFGQPQPSRNAYTGSSPRYNSPAQATPRSSYTPNYGGARSSGPAYSTPRYSQPSYGGGYSSSPYSAPRSSYSAPRYSSPSYGGSRSYAPSPSSRPSGGSAQHFSAPAGGGSSHGGGGSFGGGGHSSGGGGHASAGGGGGGHHR